jgi:hypothetical protein
MEGRQDDVAQGAGSVQFYTSCRAMSVMISNMGHGVQHLAWQEQCHEEQPKPKGHSSGIDRTLHRAKVRTR